MTSHGSGLLADPRLNVRCRYRDQLAEDSAGLTLAALAAHAVGPVTQLVAIPVLIIANAYRRLNLRNADCGASFVRACPRSSQDLDDLRTRLPRRRSPLRWPQPGLR
jgi:hypothetical protein